MQEDRLANEMPKDEVPLLLYIGTSLHSHKMPLRKIDPLATSLIHYFATSLQKLLSEKKTLLLILHILLILHKLTPMAPFSGFLLPSALGLRHRPAVSRNLVTSLLSFSTQICASMNMFWADFMRLGDLRTAQ